MSSVSMLQAGGALTGVAALAGVFKGAKRRVVPQGCVGFKERFGKPIRHRISLKPIERFRPVQIKGFHLFWRPSFEKWGQVKMYGPGLKALTLPWIHYLETVDIRKRSTELEGPVQITLSDGTTFNFNVNFEWAVRGDPVSAFAAQYEIQNLDLQVHLWLKAGVQMFIAKLALGFNQGDAAKEMMGWLKGKLDPFGSDVFDLNLTEQHATWETRVALARRVSIQKAAEGLTDVADGVLSEDAQRLPAAHVVAMASTGGQIAISPDEEALQSAVAEDPAGEGGAVLRVVASAGGRGK